MLKHACKYWNAQKIYIFVAYWTDRDSPAARLIDSSTWPLRLRFCRKAIWKSSNLRKLFDRLLDNSWRLLMYGLYCPFSLRYYRPSAGPQATSTNLDHIGFRRKLDAHVVFKYILLNMRICLTMN